MKIGCLVPVRNMRTDWVEECLLSIQNQTQPNVHAYVADDVSDDGTFEWLVDNPGLMSGLGRHDIRKGWAGGLNTASRLAINDGCDVVFTMSSDDFLDLNAMEVLSDLLQENNRDWVQCAVRQYGIPNPQTFTSKEFPELADLKTWPPLNDKVLIRSHIWEAVGGYCEDMVEATSSWGSAEDWDFWIKIFRDNYTNYKVVNEAYYSYRFHDSNLSHGREIAHPLTLEYLNSKYPWLWDMPGGWGYYGPYGPRYPTTWR